ncbi:MAG: cell division protein SepF [Candidatus Hodarchaeota archaeon]
MRFLSRLKGKDDESSSESEKTPTISGLGVFSPVMDSVEPDPLRDCKRLEQLESIFIRSKRLESLEDVPYVVNQVREGNIVLLDISHLNNGSEKTHLELKRIIERIRGETRGCMADLALVNNDCVIVTPFFVKM